MARNETHYLALPSTSNWMTVEDKQARPRPFRTWLAHLRARFENILAAIDELLLGRRKVFAGLMALVVVATALEAIGIALVMPLMAVLQGPPEDPGALTRFVIDAVGASASWIAVLVALAVVLKNGLVLVRQRWSAVVLFRLWEDWVSRIVEHVLFAPASYKEQRETGTVITTALVQTREGVRFLISFLELTVSILTFFSIYIVLLIAMWQITLSLTVVLSLAVLVGLRPISAIAHRAGVQAVKAYEASSGRLLEILGGSTYIKAFGREDYFAAEMTKSTTQARTALTTSRWIGSVLHPVVETAVVILLVGAILIFSRLPNAESGRLLPLLGVFTAASFRLFPVLTNLGRQWVAVISRQASVEKVIRSLKPVEREDGGHTVFEGLTDAIVTRDLHYQYPSRVEPALDGVSVNLERGKKTALVGESGAGKSTILSLVLGFARPQSGTIEIDGVPLDEIDVRSWRARVGYVGQDGYIFGATLGENITLGRSTENDTRLDEVARVVGLEELVGSLPEGYETVVGERGARLSGGQRQRLALARALFDRPDVLVLDEAMNALDNESVSAAMKAVTAYLPNATWVVVGHRLSTTALFDSVIVLRRGKVVEQGTHAALVERGGYYKQLYLAELAASGTEDGPEISGDVVVTKA